jgi:hypothetical protein
MAHKVPALHKATCLECPSRVNARNAQAWAHNHTDKTGHKVELQMGWEIHPDPAPPQFDPKLISG